MRNTADNTSDKEHPTPNGFGTADEDDVYRASITGNDTETCLSIDTDDEAQETHSVDTPEGISLSSVVIC